MSKYLYPIYKLKTKSYIRWWLYNYLGKFNNYVLSEILTGTSFYLEDSTDRKFNIFDMIGRTTQESTTGKNLFDSEDWYNTLHNIDNNAISKETINGIEYYKFKRANETVGKYPYMKGKFKENTQYVISARALRYNSEATSTGFSIHYTDGTYQDTYIRETTEYDYIVISQANKTIDYICLSYANSYSALIRNIQLEESSTVTSYEPYTGGEPAPNPKYPFPIKNTGDNGSVNEKVSNSDGTQEQNPSFPLAEGQKLMEGDYLTDDGIHHKMGEVVLDGTIGSYNSSANWFAMNLADLGISIGSLQLLSNYFKQYTIGELTDNTNLNGMAFNRVSYQDSTSLLIRNTDCTSSSEYRTWLASALPEVEYELAEEQTEDFTEEQKTAWKEIKKARTYKPVTHISSEDETPAELKIQYWKEV